MSKYNELVKKLKEIFQIDRPELDFGIYRILNAKADEINNYLENTLKQKISDALATAGNANKAELEKQLNSAIKAAEDAGFNAEDSPKVKDLRQQIITTSQGANEHENAVFTHLLSFFSRYYDSGDFVSKRRYKGDTYAIPYAGEEVMLHWANKDQYYIKSGENFANYSFKLKSNKIVNFKILAADVEKDNRKDNEAERRFVLIKKHSRTVIDDEGCEYEQEYEPVSFTNTESSAELTIYFEYKSTPKGTVQSESVANRKKGKLGLNELALLKVKELIPEEWRELFERSPTESNEQRTIIEKHLTTYTQRNTADYFIHKDLSYFLSNELDFYIKNEVMNLDNLQKAGAFSDIEKQLRMIQCLRAISKDLISFLSQLEDFQKKLWTKRKFITSNNFLVSLCRLPADLAIECINNEIQQKEWVNLGLVDESELSSLHVKSHPYLICDTTFFDTDFKQALINSIDNFDEEITGTLINSDNYQALMLLREKYANKLDFVYIDPPYNTVHSKILYKNQFEHSSWLSLLNNTMPLSKAMLKAESSFGFAIDDYEYNNAYKLIEHNYNNSEISTIVVNHHPQGSGGRLSRTHEYYIVASPSNAPQLLGKPKDDETEERAFMRSGTAENNYRYGRWKSFYALLFDENAKVFVGTEEPPELGSSYPLENTEEGYRRIYPINSSGEERVWRSSYLTGKERVNNGEIILTERGAVKQVIHHAGKRETLFSNWIGSEFNAGTQGTNVLDAMGLGSEFDYPKSIKTLEQSFWMQSFGNKDFNMIDYFAGSGTSAHAVINLNREDGGKRTFTLVEQGQYFDTVTKPRTIKASYSNRWVKGKSTSNSEGQSTLIKVIKLESYEDTLNNLELNKSQQTSDLFDMLNEEAKSNYLLNYMLETESKGSLLSTDDFKKPFDYKMKIAVDSAGACEEQNIDLVETFNYLIGLHVKTIESNLDKGYVRIEGTLPSGERALVLWRDCEKIQYDDFTKFAIRFDLFAKQKTFDVIYVNGDHNLPTAFTNDEDDVTRTLKLRQIEPEFLEQMFAPDELA